MRIEDKNPASAAPINPEDSGICPSLRSSKTGMTERQKGLIPVSEARRRPESSLSDGSTELTMTGSEDNRVVCHPEQAVADSRVVCHPEQAVADSRVEG